MPRERGVVAPVVPPLVDPAGDRAHLGRAHPARRDRRRADAEAGRVERLARVERDRVVVGDDAGAVERLRGGLPATPLFVRSIRIRWLSVPPETRSKPRSSSAVGERLRVRDDLRARSRANAGVRRLVRARPRSPAVVWLCGPPWRPGKTALVDRRGVLARLHMIIAPRGPRSVLWVVVVTTSACPTGDGCAPPAIRPAMCAMSATRMAPTSSAIAAKPAKSIVRGNAVPPQKMSFGRSRSASSRTSSRSMRPVSRRTPYWTRGTSLPVIDDVHAVREVAARAAAPCP